jgi:hypothetical protein
MTKPTVAFRNFAKAPRNIITGNEAWNILRSFLENICIYICIYIACRSQWPCGLMRGSAAARLLGLRVRIPPGVWMSVSCDCCVLSGRGLCDELATRPEESYRVWCV